MVLAIGGDLPELCVRQARGSFDIAVIFLVGVDKESVSAKHSGAGLSSPLSGPELGATCHPPPAGTSVNCLEIFLEVTDGTNSAAFVLHIEVGLSSLSHLNVKSLFWGPLRISKQLKIRRLQS